jgi:hypothetical protein
MDVTPALFSVAVTVGSLFPAPPAPGHSATAALVQAEVTRPAVDLPDLTSGSRRQMPPASRRPAALMPMYASLGVLQGLDVYMTSSAVQRGAVEVNPIMKPVAGSQVASLAVKAATTAASIYFTERAWKHNRKGAVILMAAINVATAVVVAHNTQVARGR